MLSKSAARAFFLSGTLLFSAVFIWLTVDTFQRIPAQTNAGDLTESVVRGKHLWEENNCMGCHTLLGEGAYYAPELTRVYDRRGPAFIGQMLRDPEAVYPGQRRMVTYDFTDEQVADMVAFFGSPPSRRSASRPQRLRFRAASVPRSFPKYAQHVTRWAESGAPLGPRSTGSVTASIEDTS